MNNSLNYIRPTMLNSLVETIFRINRKAQRVSDSKKQIHSPLETSRGYIEFTARQLRAR